MNNPFPAMKAKLQNPEFQAEAKTLAKAVAAQIVLATVVAIGTTVLVKGVTVLSDKAVDLAKANFPIGSEAEELALNELDINPK